MMIPPGFQIHSTLDAKQNLISDISSLPSNSSNLIISGEANNTIWEEAYDYIKDACLTRQCKFEFILGPVVSANNNDRSAVIELARDGYVELHVSCRRQSSHGRLFGMANDYTITEQTYLWVETYHEALTDRNIRIGRKFIGTVPFAVSEMKKFRDLFLFLKNSEYCPKAKNLDSEFIVLSETRFRKLLNDLSRYPALPSFDFIDKETLESFL